MLRWTDSSLYNRQTRPQSLAYHLTAIAKVRTRGILPRRIRTRASKVLPAGHGVVDHAQFVAGALRTCVATHGPPGAPARHGAGVDAAVRPEALLWPGQRRPEQD